MKRFISIVLSILMIALSAVSVSAVGNDVNIPGGENSGENLSALKEALIAHYDFEGDDDATRLSDKATTSNNYNDKLTESDKGSNGSNGDGKGVVLENGIATICQTAGWNRLNINTINSASEFKSLTDELTVRIRLKVNDASAVTNKDAYGVVLELGTSGKDNDVLRMWVANGETPTLNAKFANVKEVKTIKTFSLNTYLDAVFSMKLDATAQTVTINVYTSVDNGVSWTEYDDVITAENVTIASFGEIGRLNISNSSNNYTVSYDDLKFYDKELTLNEVKGQKTNVLHDGAIWSEAMIAHYDFEGDDDTTRLTDKATTSNNYNDVLAESDKGSDGSNGDGNGVVLGNGIATVKARNGWNRLQIYRMNANSEFKQLGNELTVALRFSIDDASAVADTTSWGNVFSLGIAEKTDVHADDDDLFLNCWVSSYDATANTVNLNCRFNPTTGGADNGLAPVATFELGTYIDVVLSMKLDSDTNQVTAYVYTSLDNGVNWICATKTTASSKTPVAFKEMTRMILSNTRAGYTISYDDVKVYNKALTEKQIRLQTPGAIFHGIQTTQIDTDNDSFDIRFVGSIDSLNYSKVGFRISALDGAKVWNDSADYVYETLTGVKNEGETAILEEYKSSDVRGGKSPYLYAYSIEDVPASGTVTFTVIPYYVVAEGDKTVNGIGYAITFTDGKYVSAVVLKTEAYYEKLSEITMYALGDSYFAGNGIGDKANAWPSQLASKYGMSHVNDGVGGSTVANYDGYPDTKIPMVLRYEETLPAGDVDIILVEGGTNDRGQGIPIGKNSDETDTTFKGALNVILNGLEEKFPNALIICVTPWNAPENAAYVTAMIELCENRNIAYINAADPDVVGVDMTDASFRAKYSIKPDDVSHLNMYGMQLVLPCFEKLIAEIYYEYIGVAFPNQA